MPGKEKRTTHDISLDTLRDYRKSLIHEYVTGKRRMNAIASGKGYAVCAAVNDCTCIASRFWLA